LSLLQPDVFESRAAYEDEASGRKMNSPKPETQRAIFPVKATREPDAAIAGEVIAESILQISEALRQLRKGRLNERALILLIQHAAPSVGSGLLTQREVKAVLHGIEHLETEYLKKGST
jgi:hypothetical protein